MRHATRTLGLLSLFLVGFGCGGPADEPAGEVPTLGEAGSLDGAEPGETFRVKFETSEGDVVVEVHPEWAPRGAARFRELVEEGFYDGNRFFRVVPGFVIQWGLNGDPVVNRSWRDDRFPDDTPVQSNARGLLTFATSGPNSRTTQIFVNLADNSFLDSQGFSPFAEVVEGMDVFSKVTAQYGERPNQGSITTQGNAYLEREFPDLDYVVQATIVETPDDDPAPPTEPEEGSEAEPGAPENEEPETGKPVENDEPGDDEDPSAEPSETDTPSETEPETDTNP